jgi:hypothetical protein
MKIRVLTATLAGGMTFTLAACGASSAAGGPPGQANPAVSSLGSHGTGAAPQSGHAKIDVCADLPAAAASQITGTKFTKTKANSVEGVVFGCDYHGPGMTLLQITVDTVAGKSEMGTDISALKAVGHPPAAVSGVGDQAYSEPNPAGNAGSVGASSFASYGAVFGDTYIKIGGLTYVTAAQGKQIVEQLHGKL